jgi:hypothetical protein
MIGYFSDEEGSQRLPLSILKLFYPTTGNFIAVIGKFSSMPQTGRMKRLMRKATDLHVASFNAPPKLVQGIDFSDHLSYWNQGFKALMITNTAFFRNDNYHTAQDTADLLDYERMAKVVDATYYAIKKIAR